MLSYVNFYSKQQFINSDFKYSYLQKMNLNYLISNTIEEEQEEEEKLALFMKRIINFQQMIGCKEVLLRKDWRIINLLLVAGLQDGPG